ncbi:hypothetical protein CK203_012981 [Vitis vinifera]|uniref:DUF7722 domain-containing protein n=2 Tax=Vitis vinifera TaxID=29760 RepID=A0A438JM18_VITVI|nr:hypothetical protein CK203_012981 [Vitis vinifera]
MTPDLDNVHEKKKNILYKRRPSGLSSKTLKRSPEKTTPVTTMESVARSIPTVGSAGANGLQGRDRCGQFQMPLHYPRYTQADYETMPEWKIDCLLAEYGLPVTGGVEQKRKFAMGAFLWPR